MLSQLAADYFARSPVLAYPIAALALFMIVFIVVSVRALRSHKSELDAMAALPLQDSRDCKEVEHHG
jgi:cbb3-type cytochrome oxidase subunit 3